MKKTHKPPAHNHISEYHTIVLFLWCIRQLKISKIPKYLIINILTQAKLNTFHTLSEKRWYIHTKPLTLEELCDLFTSEDNTALKKALFPEPEHKSLVFNTHHDAARCIPVTQKNIFILEIISTKDIFNPVKNDMIAPVHFFIKNFLIPFDFFKHQIDNFLLLAGNPLAYGNTLLSRYIKRFPINIHDITMGIASSMPVILSSPYKKYDTTPDDKPILHYAFSTIENSIFLTYTWIINKRIIQDTINLTDLRQGNLRLKALENAVIRPEDNHLNTALLKNIFHIFDQNKFPFLKRYYMILNETLTAVASLEKKQYGYIINNLMQYGADEKFITLSRMMRATITDNSIQQYLDNISIEDLEHAIIAMTIGGYTFDTIKNILKKYQPNIYKIAIHNTLPFLISIFAENNNKPAIEAVFCYYFEKCKIHEKTQKQLNLQLLYGYMRGKHYHKIPELMLHYSFSSDTIIEALKNSGYAQFYNPQWVHSLRISIQLSAEEQGVLNNPSITKLLESLLSYKSHINLSRSSDFPLFHGAIPHEKPPEELEETLPKYAIEAIDNNDKVMHKKFQREKKCMIF